MIPNSAGTGSPRLAAPPGASDCHIHVYDPRYPLQRPDARAVSDAGVEQYRLLQQRLGTANVVVVQPAAHGTDNRVTMDAVTALGGVRHACGIAVVTADVADGELRALDAGGIRGLRFTQHDPRTAVTTPDMIEPLANRIHAFGWHAQIHMRGDQLVEHAGLIERLPCIRVIDHMGRMPLPAGTKHPAFTLLAKWLEQGRTWVKLSGAYLNTQEGPPRYSDATAIAQALVAIAPDRMVWGSDWPHPTEVASPPDEARLFGLVRAWAGSDVLAQRILVDNPAKLYGFRQS